MAFSPRTSPQADLSVVKSFLCSFDKVLNASVWQKQGTIMARVTVTDDATVTENELRAACLEKIGVTNTPTAILMDRRVRPAA